MKEGLVIALLFATFPLNFSIRVGWVIAALEGAFSFLLQAFLVLRKVRTPQSMVPANGRAGRPDGKCNREVYCVNWLCLHG